MNSTRRTTILATAAVAIPLLARQIVAGVILHGGGGGKKRNTDLLPLGKGLTATFEATSNKTDPIKAEE